MVETDGVRIGDGGTVFGWIETSRLTELEGKISAAGRAVVEAGQALRAIRDERLYLAAGWGTFDAYCQEKWEMRRETVDRMLRGAEVARVLEEAGKKLPRTEYALRVLAPLVANPIGLIEVWERAEVAASDGVVTGAALDRIIRGDAPGGECGGYPTDKIVDGEPAPDPADAVVTPAGPAAPDDTDWDAVIRGAMGGSAGSGSAGGGSDAEGKELSDAQRISRMVRAFGTITVLSEKLREFARELSSDAAEGERAVELNSVAESASVAFEEACEAVQGWYSGDDAGLPVPEVTSADFPEPFKFD